MEELVVQPKLQNSLESLLEREVVVLIVNKAGPHSPVLSQAPHLGGLNLHGLQNFFISSKDIQGKDKYSSGSFFTWRFAVAELVNYLSKRHHSELLQCLYTQLEFISFPNTVRHLLFSYYN